MRNESGRIIGSGLSCRFTPLGPEPFTLDRVTIGQSFHWERSEEQAFSGSLLFKGRPDGTLCAINEISVEDYLKSVVASEMSALAPFEFLKAHGIISRSWLLAGLRRKERPDPGPAPAEKTVPNELIRWYEREDHDLFDVCADDHCQRYQGLARITTSAVTEALSETYGLVITSAGEVCDARYSKCCGGLSEDFATAWADITIPYLSCVSDAPFFISPIRSEEEAVRFIREKSQAFCNLSDAALLKTVLSGHDQDTGDFFRWQVSYSPQELTEIVKGKSGLDFGLITDLIPLSRGPSGRIRRLKLIGTKMSLVVGKELEIRRWLSPSHLLSSAFIVDQRGGNFVLTGAGWGHAVGLCQIGAAVMAARGFSAGEILKHYFRGVELTRIY